MHTSSTEFRTKPRNGIGESTLENRETNRVRAANGTNERTHPPPPPRKHIRSPVANGRFRRWPCLARRRLPTAPFATIRRAIPILASAVSVVTAQTQTRTWTQAYVTEHVNTMTFGTRQARKRGFHFTSHNKRGG